MNLDKYFYKKKEGHGQILNLCLFESYIYIYMFVVLSLGAVIFSLFSIVIFDDFNVAMSVSGIPGPSKIRRIPLAQVAIL